MRGVNSRKREGKWEKGMSERGRRGRTNERKEAIPQDGYGVETMAGLLASGTRTGKRSGERKGSDQGQVLLRRAAAGNKERETRK
jgi:hypothetical protein